MVIELWRDEDNNVVDVTLEAVLTRRAYRMPWRELKDAERWLSGWR